MLFTAIGTEWIRCRRSRRSARPRARHPDPSCGYLTIIGFLDQDGWRYQLTLDSSVFPEQAFTGLFRSVVGFLAAAVVRCSTISRHHRRRLVPKDDSTVADENPLWQEFARSMVPR